MYVYAAESFLRSRQLLRYSRITHYFVDLEYSVPCTQNPFTGTHPAPEEYSPYHPVLFLLDQCLYYPVYIL